RALVTYLRGLSERLYAAMRRRVEQSRARLDLLAGRPVLTMPAELLRERRQRVDDAEERAYRSVRDVVERHSRALATAVGKLDALSPLATLARGYAVPRRADDGRVVRSGTDVSPGEGLVVRLHDAELHAVVQRVETLTGGRDG